MQTAFGSALGVVATVIKDEFENPNIKTKDWITYEWVEEAW